MRIHVKILARLVFKIQLERLISGIAFQVQFTINFFCKRTTDATYLHQVVDSSASYALQTPKLFQQLPAAFRSKARNLLET